MKDSTGKSVRKQRGEFLGYKSQMTKGDAEEKLQRIIYDETGQGVAPTDRVTLSWFWANRFRPLRESRWEVSTRNTNLGDFARYVQPKLGDKLLSEFNKFLLTTHLNGMAAAKLSKPVVQRTKTLLSSIFIEAVDLEYLRSNPMTKVKMPKCKPTHKLPVIDIEDVRRPYASVVLFRDRLIFRLGVFLGLRPSELFGFTVKHWKGDVLEVRNTAYNGTLRKAKVKTDDSQRTVPVPPDMQAMLKRWTAENGLKGDDLIFPGKDAKSPMWPGVWMQKHLQRVARQIGITVPITFQVLRRSFVTRHRNES